MMRKRVTLLHAEARLLLFQKSLQISITLLHSKTFQIVLTFHSKPGNRIMCLIMNIHIKNEFVSKVLNKIKLYFYSQLRLSEIKSYPVISFSNSLFFFFSWSKLFSRDCFNSMYFFNCSFSSSDLEKKQVQKIIFKHLERLILS